ESPVAAAIPAVPATISGVGRVAVHSQPEGAKISVDGKSTAYRSPANFELSAGKHQITAEHKGFETQTIEIVVPANQTYTVDMGLQADSNPKKHGILPFR